MATSTLKILHIHLNLSCPSTYTIKFNLINLRNLKNMFQVPSYLLAVRSVHRECHNQQSLYKLFSTTKNYFTCSPSFFSPNLTTIIRDVVREPKMILYCLPSQN